MCLFLYGLTISGYIIDKMGIKFSLVLGLSMITIAKFMLTFIEDRTHLYILMFTISPFGISIIFPSQLLGVKKLTNPGPMRVLAFNIYYGAMILGGVLGGPIVDYIRRDIGKTQFEYYHTNIITGQQEKRYIEISAWRAICFFGFLMSFFMLLISLSYKSEKEKMFVEEQIDDDERERLSCMSIVYEII